ncbi:MAG TPA: hypothetical protein VFR01_00485 [Geobacterales bacterium]|nr:hypothetical protein [Geobacterales bacterium]
MSLPQPHERIIDLYLQQELLMARLYTMYANFYEEEREFWLSMAQEELEHAGWVKLLKEQAIRGAVAFSEGKTRTYTLASMVEYLEKTISTFGCGDFSHTQALSVALDLEKSLIEKQVFQHFAGDGVETKKILALLNDGQDHHLRRLQEYARQKRSN